MSNTVASTVVVGIIVDGGAGRLARLRTPTA